MVGAREMSLAFDLGRSTEVLRRTPATLQALLGGLDPFWTQANEGPDTFSPFDVVGHLIDAEETNWLPRARVILAQDLAAVFEPFDRFRHRTRNVGRSLPALLGEFAHLRAANLGELASWRLSDEQLGQAADHPDLGRVSLRQLLATWVVHDLGHLAQVARVMAKQYKEEIGPWAAFLPVVTDRS